MKTIEHTPGPWSYGGFTADNVRLPNLCQRVFMPGNAAAFVTGEAQIANARLIAAAPDLLMALERMLDHTVRASRDYDATAVARGAIAKARGAIDTDN